MERDLPTWYPHAALAMIPATILAAAVFGHDNDFWALAALGLGTFFFVLLIALWAAPEGLAGTALAFALALGTASLLTLGLRGLSQITPADLNPPASTAPTSVPPVSSLTTSPGSP